MDYHGLLTLSQVPGIGSTRLRALIAHFHSPSAVFAASARELVKVPGIEEKTARSIRRFTDGERFADDQLRRLKRINARLVSLWDNDYPEHLKRIYDPPPFLFVRGSLTDSDVYAIAIVGTRNPTTYGKMLADKFSTELSRLGITVVSGLARGIDTIAHAAAAKAGARTIAIIGSGLDVIYPPENQKLADDISRNGAVVSEFEMGAQPDAEHFPRRNRIISGATLGTLVIETDVDGGAMLTARWALDQNREVFAVPGPILEKRSAGCNSLIKRGEAKLVQSVDDILEELTPKFRPILKGTGEQKPEPQLSFFEKRILDAIDDEPRHIDIIAAKTSISTADALVQLLGLEFKGLVKQLAGKMFVRV
jgi:DNA processing protein